MNKFANTYIPLVYEFWHSFGFIVYKKKLIKQT